MRFLFVFALLLSVLGTGSFAQERYVKPVDEGPKDASFDAFRKKTISAAERKDVRYILSILDPGIKSSFGGHDGIGDFRSFWKINEQNSQFWREFLLVIRNGGKFDRNGRNLMFVAPYLFSTMPTDLDQFEYHAIFGKNVNLREKPDSKAAVLESLSYNIVKIDEPAALKRKTGPGEFDWVYDWHKIETLGGKKGWVNAEYVRSPIDYRAGFEKKAGRLEIDVLPGRRLMFMSNSVERFSDRVENYVKYRPDYPTEVLSFLRQECGLSREAIVADIGCGTGISSRIFLENGNRVFGVEPNMQMREAAVNYLSKFPWFIPIDGTAEATTLPSASVDLVVAAQAFHWFDAAKTRSEFLRILRRGGRIVLMWNERSLDADGFHIGYESLLNKYAEDYEKVRHDKKERFDLDAFFPGDYKEASFTNHQELDFEGIKGRVLSSSYMPNEGHESYEAMIEELRFLFAKHAESGKIKVFYSTKVYFSPC